jgi:diadenosine tetraphosphate (Ap4A) HIT family hydrolase
MGGLWHRSSGPCAGPWYHPQTEEDLRTLLCPFCQIDQQRVVASNDLAVAIRDLYPVNPGHTLVIPRRHLADWFDATTEEQQAILALLREVKVEQDRQARPPDGYNVGVNVGSAAGQTVMHLHAHLIPRFDGDVEDPRGGVRWVVPERGRYPFDEEPGA